MERETEIPHFSLVNTTHHFEAAGGDRAVSNNMLNCKMLVWMFDDLYFKYRTCMQMVPFALF